MLNKKIGYLFSLFVAASLAVVAAAGSLQARSIVGASGHAAPFADQGCFSTFYGTMRNTCSSTKTLELPLATDREGTHNVVVSAYAAAPSNTVGCVAIAINKTYTGYWSSPTLYLPSFGASQDISLSVYVPASGALQTTCYLNPEGRINVVNW